MIFRRLTRIHQIDEGFDKGFSVECHSDSAHKTESTEDEFRNELAKAELDIQKLIFRWGEMYAVAVPSLKSEV